MRFEAEKNILPAFPRTPHLPHSPNTSGEDLIATHEEVAIVFTQPVNIEEKIDGASVGMCLYEGNALIRNRDHILRKGYYKDTTAKKQFLPIWNWFYKHREAFEALVEMGPYSVYGEWCLAQHGIMYDQLPDLFIAYDLYDQEKRTFLSPIKAREILTNLGFYLPKLLHQGVFDGGYERLVELSNQQAEWSPEKLEGIYLKVYDNETILERFKMVRTDFIRGMNWDPQELKKNKVAK